MDTLYDRNGLVFWTEKEIRLRNMMVDYFVNGLRDILKSENRAFEMIQIESAHPHPTRFHQPQLYSQ